jgi:hypothetical protein
VWAICCSGRGGSGWKSVSTYFVLIAKIYMRIEGLRTLLEKKF